MQLVVHIEKLRSGFRVLRLNMNNCSNGDRKSGLNILNR
jgi:hypothetical protein